MKNTVKTLLSGLTTLAVTFSALSFTALATENKDTNDMTELIISSHEAYAGDIVTVTVGIKNNPGIRAFTAVLDINLDLDFLNSNVGNKFSVINTKKIDNRIGVGVVSTSIVSVDTTIAELRFKVPEDAEVGTIYELNWEKVGQLSAGYGEIENIQRNGSITVIEKETIEPQLIGNINNDGKVDVIDASTILEISMSNLMGKKVDLTEEQFKAADVNNDGVITVIDAYLVLDYSLRSLFNPNITWEDVLNR